MIVENKAGIIEDLYKKVDRGHKLMNEVEALQDMYTASGAIVSNEIKTANTEKWLEGFMMVDYSLYYAATMLSDLLGVEYKEVKDLLNNDFKNILTLLERAKRENKL